MKVPDEGLGEGATEEQAGSRLVARTGEESPRTTPAPSPSGPWTIYWCPICERQMPRSWHVASRPNPLIPQSDVEHECVEIEVVSAQWALEQKQEVEAILRQAVILDYDPSRTDEQNAEIGRRSQVVRDYLNREGAP